MDADADREITGTCRGHCEREANRHPESVVIYLHIHKAGTKCGLRRERITFHRKGTRHSLMRSYSCPQVPSVM